MLGGEYLVGVLARKLRACIEAHLQRGGMRLDQHVWDDRLAPQLGMRAFVPGVLVWTDVIPRPSIEAAQADARNVLWRKIIAQLVALVDRGPQVMRLRVDSNSNGVADSGGVDALSRTVRIELQDVRTFLFQFGALVLYVGKRAYGNEHLTGVRRKDYVPGPMSCAPQ